LVVFPKKAGKPKSGDATVCHSFSFGGIPLTLRVTTSLPTLPEAPSPSPPFTSPKLPDRSPRRRRNSTLSGPSESHEPTRGTLESEPSELPPRPPRRLLPRSSLLFLSWSWRLGVGHESRVVYARFSHWMFVSAFWFCVARALPGDVHEDADHIDEDLHSRALLYTFTYLTALVAVCQPCSELYGVEDSVPVIPSAILGHAGQNGAVPRSCVTP
jgi:hypothetical protein